MPSDNLMFIGQTGIIKHFPLRDSTTGQLLSGKIHSDFTGWYNLVGGAEVALSFSSGAVGDSYTSGKLVPLGHGRYAYHVPNAMFLSAGSISANLTVSGAIDVHLDWEVVSVNRNNAVRFGLSALPNAAADASGGLPISDAGGLDLDAKLDAAITSRMATYIQPTGFLTATFPTVVASTTNIISATGIIVSAIGDNVITAASIAADAITDAKVASDVTIASVTGSVGSVSTVTNIVSAGPITTLSGAVVNVDTVDVLTTYTGNTPQTGDSFARLGAPAGVSISADIAVIESQTDDIGVAGAGLTALATQASVNIIDDFLDTEITAIKTKTDFLPSATAGAAGGLFVAGSNSATTAATWTVTGETTHTGAVSMGAGLTISQSTLNEEGLQITGNGSAPAVLITNAGKTAAGLQIVGGTNSDGIIVQGNGSGGGAHIEGGITGIGLHLLGGSTSGSAIKVVAQGTNDHAVELVSIGTGKGLYTDSISVTGVFTAGTNAIPWNTAWDIEVQSEAADAIAAAGLATQTSVNTIDDFLDTEIADIKAKTDLLVTFPTNFSSLGINASGHISRVTLVDQTTTNSDMITASAIATAVFTTQLTEAYAADGIAPTLTEAIFLIQQAFTEFTISGSIISVKNLAGTMAAEYTMDNAILPTQRLRTL